MRQAIPKPKTVKVGEAGLVIVKYLGFQEKQVYRGLVTGATYEFGMIRPRGMVDSRDTPSMLEIVEDTQWVFEVE